MSDTYLYDAFGISIGGTGTTLNSYRYAGEQWDDDLKMYYLRSRYYKPETGRFWTMDMFEGGQEEPMRLHKYLYSGANPVNLIDPLGFTWETQFGQAVEKVIRDDFWRQDINHRYREEVALSTLLGQPYTGAYRLRLDLAHEETGNNYFYEIKHCTLPEIYKGYRKIARYQGVLGMNWRTGTMSEYTYGMGRFPLIKTDLAGNPLPGGYYALVLPPVHGLLTYMRVKPSTPHEVLQVILAFMLSTARVLPEAGPAAADLAAAARTAGGMLEVGKAAAQIGTVMEVTVEAEVVAVSLEAL
jgi:RHS repeat-associated protein